MQKLVGRDTYTPTDASQVRSNCDLQLNRDESLGVADLKTPSNNPEVNQRQTNSQGLQPLVFVLSIVGKPLMPTKSSRARKMLLSGRAKVVKRLPFTIQLTVECEDKVQDVMLGIDTGFGNIGFSAVSDKRELVSGVLKLDDKTKSRLDEKRMYRRGRRNKLWYRMAKWLNRKTSKDWLPPSVERRYQTHLNLINRIKSILPVSKVIIEAAKFDIQKIENPETQGVGYQQGNLYEYQNIRAYLMSREYGLCQLCCKDFKGQPSHVHHIIPRGEVGNNRVGNLAILHKKCHDKLHEKHLESKLKSNAKNYKQSTFMSIINDKFWEDVPGMGRTYGNITFVNRNKLGLEKSHINDAFVIAGGNTQARNQAIEIKQVHRNNRVLQLNRNGFRPSIKRNKSKMNPGDLFWTKRDQYGSTVLSYRSTVLPYRSTVLPYTCKGMFSQGKQVLYGDVKKKEYVKYEDVTKIFHFGSLLWTI